MDWQERERLLFTGFPLALIPALALLPLFEHLVMEPSLAHSKIISWAIFPLMAIAEILGVSRVVRSFVRQPFDLITAVAWGTMCILIVIAIYTGIFFAVFAARR
jgi:hypothetical protein